MRESSVQADIMRRLCVGAVRLFRNNIGTFWTGKPVRHPDGSVTLHGARVVVCGLTPGSSDLVGWRSVVVTPEMVGTTVAVFVSLEIKSATGRLSPEQANWLRVVSEAGGLAGVARSVEDAERVLTPG